MVVVKIQKNADSKLRPSGFSGWGLRQNLLKDLSTYQYAGFDRLKSSLLYNLYGIISNVTCRHVIMLHWNCKSLQVHIKYYIAKKKEKLQVYIIIKTKNWVMKCIFLSSEENETICMCYILVLLNLEIHSDSPTFFNYTQLLPLSLFSTGYCIIAYYILRKVIEIKTYLFPNLCTFGDTGVTWMDMLIWSCNKLVTVLY